MLSRLTTLLKRPASAVLALTAACLIAFCATLPLPRVDHELIGSDGIRYYVYLPSLLIDGDLDLTDEYQHFYRSEPLTVRHLLADQTATGLPANRFGIGPAILWSPHFIIAHLLALLLRVFGLDLVTDGTSWFYQVPVLIGSIVYGGLGAWLCFRAARHLASQTAALASTLMIVLAGNPIYYLTVEPSMSHPLSMFASAAFFYVWIASPSPAKPPITLGALAGLMALIRPQDGLFLLLPIAGSALAIHRDRQATWLAGWAASLRMAIAALLVFSPQLVVWKLLNGSFLRSGYAEEFGALFHWPWQNMLPVLFSAQRGLFVWHPIFFVAVAGLWLLGRHGSSTRPFAKSFQGGDIAALGLTGLAIQWLVISSWREWTQGDAFGGRMFIVCTPIFVFGLAALLDVAARHWPWRRILACGALLIVLNGLLLIHYRVELLSLARPLTYLDLTAGRFRLGPLS